MAAVVLLAMAVGVWPQAAAAQTAAPRVDIETLYLDPAGRGSLTVGTGETLKQGKFRVGLGFGYQYGHLQLSSTVASGDVVLRDRVDAQLFAAVGATDWLELGATIPVIIAQFTSRPVFDVTMAGLGTPQLHARLGILNDKRPLFLSLGLSAGLPLGSSGALSNQGLWIQPRLNLGKRFTSFLLAGEVAGLIRTNTVSLASYGGGYWDQVGNLITGSLSIGTLGDRARGELTVRVQAPLQAGWFGVEGLLGLRVPVKQTEFFLALGPGFGGGPTMPAFRVYLGAAYGNSAKKECIEGEAYELVDCPNLDRDGDGVKNSVDKEPLKPEDLDGYQDDDGAPDPDNDGDGLLDGEDKCPNERGTPEASGCADRDTDGDHVVDRLDKCPDVAEDLDGFEDDDGCPEPDNDGDQIEDAKDACPMEKGIPEERGCPVKDDDGDTVPNHLDNCPTIKGDPANGGCPAEDKQLVVITRERLRILDTVRFATNRASLLPGSFRLLDQVAAVMVAQPRLKVIQVEGHTDNVGDPAKNQKLSEERAAAVRDYLMKKGVAGERVKSAGFGADRPIESNSTAKGRETNRRVEFNIVEQD